MLSLTALLAGAAIIPAAIAIGATPGNPDPASTVFELEGNANDTAGFTGDDWSDVFAGTSSADATTFLEESDRGDRSASIFTGGGSKDPELISSWKWKDGSGGLPDKDNLQNAFAARYGDLLVFGSDRFDNSGDAQQGFWFFQEEVATNPDGTFRGAHTEGDLLILSDFSIGGTVSTIAIYRWVESGGDVAPHLDVLFDSAVFGNNAANCLVDPTNPASAKTSGDVCGVVNPSSTTGNQTGGWNFTDKSGNDFYLQGEFFEGGIDLSAFPEFTGACFASFAAETRSSRSPTATLKDFVLGGFQACESSVTTEQSWIPNDSATVAVPDASSWSGNVTFTLHAGSCAGPVLYTEGPKAVSTASPTTSTTNAGAGSGGYTATATGDFFWQVDFTSTTNGVSGSSHCESTSMTITN
jgi:hypothetical protein